MAGARVNEQSRSVGGGRKTVSMSGGRVAEFP